MEEKTIETTLDAVVDQAVADYDEIEESIESTGVDVPVGTPTADYAELIGDIPTVVAPRKVVQGIATETINKNNLVSVDASPITVSTLQTTPQYKFQTYNSDGTYTDLDDTTWTEKSRETRNYIYFDKVNNILFLGSDIIDLNEKAYRSVRMDYLSPYLKSIMDVFDTSYSHYIINVITCMNVDDTFYLNHHIYKSTSSITSDLDYMYRYNDEAGQFQRISDFDYGDIWQRINDLHFTNPDVTTNKTSYNYRRYMFKYNDYYYYIITQGSVACMNKYDSDFNLVATHDILDEAYLNSGGTRASLVRIVGDYLIFPASFNGATSSLSVIKLDYFESNFSNLVATDFKGFNPWFNKASNLLYGSGDIITSISQPRSLYYDATNKLLKTFSIDISVTSASTTDPSIKQYRCSLILSSYYILNLETGVLSDMGQNHSVSKALATNIFHIDYPADGTTPSISFHNQRIYDTNTPNIKKYKGLICVHDPNTATTTYKTIEALLDIDQVLPTSVTNALVSYSLDEALANYKDYGVTDPSYVPALIPDDTTAIEDFTKEDTVLRGLGYWSNPEYTPNIRYWETYIKLDTAHKTTLVHDLSQAQHIGTANESALVGDPVEVRVWTEMDGD